MRSRRELTERQADNLSKNISMILEDLLKNYEKKSRPIYYLIQLLEQNLNIININLNIITLITKEK